MNPKVVALVIDRSRVRVRTASKDSNGGVSFGGRVWPTQESDWVRVQVWSWLSFGRVWKDAIIVREWDTEPIQPNPKLPGIREHPKVLGDYKRSMTVYELTLASMREKKGMSLFDRFPIWFWLAVVGVIFAVVWFLIDPSGFKEFTHLGK